LAPACAGEEFTSTESSSSNFSGSSGDVGAGGNRAQGGAGLGGTPTVTRGGTANANNSSGGAASAPSVSGGEPGVAGEPNTKGGAATGEGGDTSSAGAGAVGGSNDTGGTGGTDDGDCPLGMVGPTCSNRIRACRDLPVGTADGMYRIDPDGTGPIAAFDASCAFDASGGWTLVLNYVHKGGTNPAVAVRKDSLPVLGSDTLGTDESASVQNWGHAGTALLSALGPQKLRFYGRTSAHERVIDFTTTDHDCLGYAMGGTTNCKAVVTAASLLPAHTASLPRIATAFMSGKGDLALTEFPFYLGGQAHWAVKGETQRWEVDNTPVAGVVKYLYDTIHRVWMR
jgi:hypothetical protein